MIPVEILDRLFEAPLEDFTSTRNELVAELKPTDEGAAKVLKGFKKPTLSAWAVNRLARREPDALRRLFEVRDEIAEATNAKSMREASDLRKKLLASLATKAGHVLQESGHAASSSTIERITQTLRAGDSDEEREAILSGRLTRDLEPSGFGGNALFGFDPGDEAEQPDAEDEADLEARKKAAALNAEAEEAESEAAQREARAGEAAEEARLAERGAAAARKLAKKVRERADKAHEALS